MDQTKRLIAIHWRYRIWLPESDIARNRNELAPSGGICKLLLSNPPKQRRSARPKSCDPRLDPLFPQQPDFGYLSKDHIGE
jgi:hypothetical protein